MPRSPVVVLLALGALIGAAPAAAATTPRQQAISHLKAGAKQLRRTNGGLFAEGVQRQLVRTLGRAATDVRKNRLCTAVGETDGVRTALLAGGTWQGAVPRTLVGKVDRRLARAERLLLGLRGMIRCGRASRHTKRVRAHHAAGPYDPLKGPGGPIEQGENETTELVQGRFRPLTKPGRATPVTGQLQAAIQLLLPTDPFHFDRITDLGGPPITNTPMEPTTAISPRGVVWYTGNSSVAYSTDFGAHFTFRNPSTLIDDAGLPFCCDQLVSYAPSVDLFVWLTQYWCSVGSSSPASNRCDAGGTGSNRLRIAVASPAAIAANPATAWTWWDLPPSLFGEGGTAWFDRSDMAVGRTTVSLTSDRMRSAHGGGALIARMSLQQLQARGTITISYIFDGAAGVQKVAQGEPVGTTYVGGNDDASRARIWSWVEGAPTLFLHHTRHTTLPTWDLAALGTDSADWNSRQGIFPGQLEGLTVRGPELWVSWTVGRSYCTQNCDKATRTLNQVLPQPSIQTATLDRGSYALTRERWIWNPTLPFSYSSLQTSGDGDVGLSFMYSGSPGNAIPVAGYLTTREEFFAVLGGSDPYLAGDYYSLRPGPNRSSLVMSGFANPRSVTGGPGTGRHWYFAQYSRRPG